MDGTARFLLGAIAADGIGEADVRGEAGAGGLRQSARGGGSADAPRSADGLRRVFARDRHRAREHPLRAGHRAQARAHQAAGRGLGERDAQPPGREQLDDGGLHVVVVDREHEVPEPFAQPGLFFREQGFRRFRVGPPWR